MYTCTCNDTRQVVNKLYITSMNHCVQVLMNSDIKCICVRAGWKIKWCNGADCPSIESHALILFVDVKHHCVSMPRGANHLQTGTLL